MLETLTKGFRSARDRFQGITQLSEENIAEALRDVRLSLLEADVDLGIVRDFLDKVKQRCLGESVALRTGKRSRQMRVRAGDHFTKACYEELVALMGADEPIVPAPGRTRVLMMVGLQGTGKTTTCAKLALHLKKSGEKPLLVGADVRRPAAREQLRVLADQIGVEAFTPEGEDAAEICAEAVAHARENGLDTVILDTAGRLHIDDELMRELAHISERTSPEFTTLVCDSMMGREAVNVAQGFAARLELDGLILTKLDGDSRGGAALAIRQATGIPIRCVTMGEGHDRLETFRAEGLASRILGMGDVVGLIQDFEGALDAEEAERRIVNPDDASRAALQEVVNTAFGTNVTLADDALTDSSLLTIERRPQPTMENQNPLGRNMEMPFQLRLYINGTDCVLVDQRDHARYTLSNTSCEAE